MALKALFLSLAIALPLTRAAAPCVSGVATYNVNALTNVPDGTAQLFWDGAQVLNSSGICPFFTSIPCTPVTPKSAPNLVVVPEHKFELYSGNTKGPFRLRSFYFGCQTRFADRLVPAPCTLQVIQETSDPNLVTKSFSYTGSASKPAMAQIALTEQTTHVYFSVIAGGVSTTLFLDSFVVEQTC